MIRVAYKVDNAIIMAAGTASRFAPISYEMPKALIEVKGEVLIERQIRQLQEAGIKEIIVVVGYKKEQFYYLKDKFNVILIENKEYLSRNNNGSIFAVREYLKNSYICSSDNYFSINPFETQVDDSYYAAVYSKGRTLEWCMSEDDEGFIDSVTVGGSDTWYMLGHTFWSEKFSKTFLGILDTVYHLNETKDKLWEKIYIEHLDELKMKMRRYGQNEIFEFDTLDELRLFDTSYVENTRSQIIKEVASKLSSKECEITDLIAYKTENNSAAGFYFKINQNKYRYDYETKEMEQLKCLN